MWTPRSRTWLVGAIMGFSRQRACPTPMTGDHLVGALAGLGMAFAVTPIPDANIEDTVLAASLAGMEDDDYRILGLLVAWLDDHRARLLADRLIHLVSDLTTPRTRALWQALALRWDDDRRWARLATLTSEPIDLVRTGSAFLLGRHGPDPRFATTGLIVPAGVLRHRPGDVLTPRQVAAQHRAYRYRVLMGSGYRADLWAALEGDPSLTASDLARRTYASFATAWQVKRDFATLAA